MTSTFLQLVKESWNKTDGIKGSVWKIIGIIALIYLGLAILGLGVVFYYLLPIIKGLKHSHPIPWHEIFSLHHIGINITIFIVHFILSLWAILIALYLESAIPYLSLHHLQGNTNLKAALQKAFSKKAALLFNVVLFAIISILLQCLLHIRDLKIFSFVLIPLVYINVLFKIAYYLSLLSILEEKRGVFKSFCHSWLTFFSHLPLMLLSGIWIVFLGIFSLITLGVGSIWAVPAQYNTYALLYKRHNLK